MKNTAPLTVLLAAVSLLSVSALQAADKAFKFSIGSNQTLVIQAPDGTALETLPMATVGKTVHFGSDFFQVSYGQDANGDLSLIVTADPDHPTDVAFTFEGRDIAMDQTSAVILTLTNQGQNVVVDPGSTGSVKVNGQRVSTPVVTNSSDGTPGGTISIAALNAPPTTSAADGTPSAGPTQQPQLQQPTGTSTSLTMDDPLSDARSTLVTSDVRTNPSAVVNPVTSANPTSPS